MLAAHFESAVPAVEEGSNPSMIVGFGAFLALVILGVLTSIFRGRKESKGGTVMRRSCDYIGTSVTETFRATVASYLAGQLLA